jgi:hypothetical protein
MNPFLFDNVAFFATLLLVIAVFRNRKKTRINKRLYYALFMGMVFSLFQFARVQYYNYTWLFTFWDKGIEIYPEASFQLAYKSREYGNKRAWEYHTKDSEQQVIDYYRGVVANKLSLTGNEHPAETRGGSSVDTFIKYKERIVQINFPDRTKEQFFIYVIQRGKIVEITYYLDVKD